MRDQSSQCVLWSTICLRTSQSKISAPPPVSDSRPASISSSRISSARQSGDLLEPVDLGRGEALERDVGQRGLQLAQHPRVVLPRQRRVQAVDDVQLGEPVVLHRQRLLDGLLDAHRVRVLLAGLALEGAVGAGRGADVGQVEVPVDVEDTCVAVLARCARWWARPPSQARSSDVVQVLAVLAGEPLAGRDLLGQFGLAGRRQRHGTQGTSRPRAFPIWPVHRVTSSCLTPIASSTRPAMKSTSCCTDCGRTVEAGAGRQDHGARVVQRHHVLERRAGVWRFARNDDELTAFLEGHVGGALQQILGQADRDAGHGGRRRGDDDHSARRVGTAGRPRCQVAGGPVPDVTGFPAEPFREVGPPVAVAERHPRLVQDRQPRRARNDQVHLLGRVEEPAQDGPRVWRARGTGYANHPWHARHMPSPWATRSASAKTNRPMPMTPFAVKNARLTRRRSSACTIACS